MLRTACRWADKDKALADFTPAERRNMGHGDICNSGHEYMGGGRLEYCDCILGGVRRWAPELPGGSCTGHVHRAPEQQQDADADVDAAAGAGADAGADAGAVAAGPVVAEVVEAVEAEAEAVDADDWDPIRQRHSTRHGDSVRAARRRQDAADAVRDAAAQLSSDEEYDGDGFLFEDTDDPDFRAAARTSLADPSLCTGSGSDSDPPLDQDDDALDALDAGPSRS